MLIVFVLNGVSLDHNWKVRRLWSYSATWILYSRRIFLDAHLLTQRVSRVFDPRVDLSAYDWSPLEKPTFVLPILSELTDWRGKLHSLKKEYRDQTLDVTFVADFPGDSKWSLLRSALFVFGTSCYYWFHLEIQNVSGRFLKHKLNVLDEFPRFRRSENSALVQMQKNS